MWPTMLRGFRHTLFLLLQVGVVISGGVALLVQPSAWRAIAICAVAILWTGFGPDTLVPGVPSLLSWVQESLPVLQ